MVVPVPTDLKCVAAIKFRMSVYLQKTIKLPAESFNGLFCLFTVFNVIHLKNELQIIALCVIYVSDR